MDYLDFGSSSDSDGEGDRDNPMTAIDSDEEERRDNTRILKMLSMHSSTGPSSRNKNQQKIMDFEAEMEAELDRRAFAIEVEGGLEHQRSLSRSSSSSSLSSLPRTSSSAATLAIPALDNKPGHSSLKRTLPEAINTDGRKIKGPPPGANTKKSVKFADSPSRPDGQVSTATTSGTVSEQVGADEFYDKVYFDSDESEGEDDFAKKTKRKKRQLMSDEDLFYDPNSDAEDQAWVDKQRREYCRRIPKKGDNTNKGNNSNSGTGSDGNTGIAIDTTENIERNASNSSVIEPPLPKTDAVLNCPACFTVLCMDCQRHEFYSGQYRAMFVVNCKIDKTETLKVPLKQSKSKSRKAKNRQSDPQTTVMENIATDPGDTFFPVRCKICNSQVAVYDRDEIYHFFNCLASHP